MQLAAHSEASLLARFMGLTEWAKVDDLDLVERIERGIPTRSAEIIVQRIDPKGDHLQVTDIIPKATYHRRKNQKLTRELSERVLGLSRVFAETMRIYHEEAALALVFLMKPHPMLGGRSPFELSRESTAGADLVLKLLAKAEAGVAV